MNKIWSSNIKLNQKVILNTEEDNDSEKIDSKSLTWLIFLGIGSYYISEIISENFIKIPSILILTTIGILLAQIEFISKIRGSQTIGLYLVYLFLAVIGAYCELSAVSQLQEVGATLLIFTSIAVLIHGLVFTFIGGLVYRDWEMISIASQANIGGGASAIALAESFNRKELILPAILVGSLGNALGTYLGFLVVYIL